MQISEEKHNQVHIFKIEGALDSKTSPFFAERLAAAIAAGEKQMIIDFANLNYLSSAGSRVILQTYKKLKHLEGKIVLCSLVDYVREIFEIAGFDSFLPITASFAEAESIFPVDSSRAGSSLPRPAESPQKAAA